MLSIFFVYLLPIYMSFLKKCLVLMNLFARQEWRCRHKENKLVDTGGEGGLPFPPLGDLPHPRIKPITPALADGFFTTELPRKPLIYYLLLCF